MKTILKWSIIVFLGLQISCRSHELNHSVTTAFGRFNYSENDMNTITDLVHACNVHLPQISKDLNLQINNSVVIELYPSQDEYNRNIMNSDLKNSPAISGNGKIQIVSPLAKIRSGGLKYEDRLLFLIHEYIHLLIDKLKPEPPIFIDEGIACYYSSYDFYMSSTKKYLKQLNFTPSVEQLVNHYYDLPVPDLFSFLFIDYIVKSKGKDILPVLLRQPEIYFSQEVDKNWKSYIQQNYFPD